MQIFILVQRLSRKHDTMGRQIDSTFDLKRRQKVVIKSKVNREWNLIAELKKRLPILC